MQWDEPSVILRPEWVSPWEIEPLTAANTPQVAPQPISRNKRPRPTSIPVTPRPEISPAHGKSLLIKEFISIIFFYKYSIISSIWLYYYNRSLEVSNGVFQSTGVLLSWFPTPATVLCICIHSSPPNIFSSFGFISNEAANYIYTELKPDSFQLKPIFNWT